MQRRNGEKGEGGSEEANQMRHLSNWHATWRSNTQTAGRHFRGGGRGMVPKRAACCMRGKLAMKFRFILPKCALKNAEVFYMKCLLQLATACVASSIYFFLYFFGLDSRLDKSLCGHRLRNFCGTLHAPLLAWGICSSACGAANTLRILNKLLHGSSRRLPIPRRDCLGNPQIHCKWKSRNRRE